MNDRMMLFDPQTSGGLLLGSAAGSKSTPSEPSAAN